MTILKLQPTDLSEIVFSIDTVGSNGYYVPATTIDLHVSEREEIVYSETQYGGEAVYTKNKLAPVTFVVFVWGDTRAEMLTRSHALNRAIEKGGKLEFKPTGASRSTFFTYIRSAKPVVSQISNNQWDASNADHERHVMSFEVELKTKPVGDSGTWELYIEGWTVDNTYDASYNNSVDITDVIGDQPAALQLFIGSGDENDLRKIIMSSRSSQKSVLNNLYTIYEAEDYERETGAWTNQVDASRSNGEYEQLTPASSTVWYNKRWAMQNLADHKGLLAFLPVVRVQDTDAKFRISFLAGGLGSEILVSDDTYSVGVADEWVVLYAGEYTFPIVAESEIQPNITLKLEIMSSDVVDIDFVAVMFSDESIIEIDFGDSLLDPDTLLYLSVSDTPNRIANVVQWGGSAYDLLDVPYRIYGSLFMEAFVESKLFFLFENETGHVASDTLSITPYIKYRTIYPFG